MNRLIQFLEGRKENALRQGILWNMVASGLYSFQSALLLLAVTRIGGLEAAGVFSIVYSVSQMFASVGSYSMREYQVSDTKRRFLFPTYFSSRCVTVAVMFTVCGGYALFQGYRGEKLAALLLLSAYRGVDGMEDVFSGEYQRNGRLDIAAKLQSIRIFTASFMFVFTYFFTKSIAGAALVMLLTAGVIFCAGAGAFAPRFQLQRHWCGKGIKELLFSCFPVCAGAFLYNYLVNSPKYAIDKLLSEEMQAVFNILFMPVFVIAMLSAFVFKPLLYPMGEAWNNGEQKRFVKMVLRQVGVIVGLAVAVVLGGSLLGIPVLSFIYGVDLGEYHEVFTVLLVFGGIAAMDAFGSAVLTVMRRQGFILVAYGIAFLLDILLMERIVAQFQLMGAGLVYGMVMSVILVVYAAVIGVTLVRGKKSRNGGGHGNA